MNFSRNRLKIAAAAAALTAVLSLSACVNLFDPIDNPSGDAQILSAARAAFDRGDLQEARDLYAKLGSNEVALSETIFTHLEECGAGIEAVGAALGGATSGSAGVILTVMGEKMNALHGTACLATLLAAYRSSQTLTDPSLKNFTGFLAAIAVAGEVLAHNTGITAAGTLAVTDIVTNGAATSCVLASCGVGCGVTAKGITAAAAIDLSSSGPATITPTWGAFHGGITAANTALTALGISTGPSATLMNALVSLDPSVLDNNPTGYACALHDIGIGR